MKRILSLVLMMGLVFSISLSGLMVSAETSSYDEQIERTEKAKADAQKRMKDLQKDLKALEKDKSNIVKYVEKVDKKINKVTKAIADLDDQVKGAREELIKLEEEYTIAENKEKEQYETMKKRIKYMYESGNDGYVEVMFSASSIGDFLNRSEYIEKISAYDTNLFEEYVVIKNETEIKRSVMEGKVEEIAGLKDQAKAEKSALKSLKSSKKAEIKKLNKAISATDTRAQTFRDQVAAAEQKVENLLLKKQKEINEREAAKKAATANSGTTAADTATDTYASNTNGLRWPLRIAGRISSKFGVRTQPTAGASTNHQGIDIAASAGTPIVAAGAGTVVTASYSASAGNFVMLYHGNSLYTVYMHASKLAVSEGQTVKQGDVIAYVGSTGVSTGAHLHFGVSVNGTYVDPLNYVSQ